MTAPTRVQLTQISYASHPQSVGNPPACRIRLAFQHSRNQRLLPIAFPAPFEFPLCPVAPGKFGSYPPPASADPPEPPPQFPIDTDPKRDYKNVMID